MNANKLDSVIESVEDWAGSRSGMGHEPDAQTALAISCLMSSCKLSEPLWPVDATWNVVSVETLGNQTQERYEGKTVPDSTIEHLRTQHDIKAVLVVGHTSCEVLGDAYERWIAPDTESPVGIKARLEPLRSLVGKGFEQGVLTESLSLQTVQYRLTEYNVRQQVQFLQQAFPSSVTIAGYVHDQDGVYNSFPDRRYLVALDGVTDPTTIRARLPDDASIRVASLLT
ncbi:carbonic anhydrase [Halorubrum rutilum]|uniref:Carbonic anhydrase n=1 Tax=Halorubrum rutilum TaxID=1364933 RepID=A0ABD6AP47_9EURY|nr:carbonic anhydrase [Halorubrum rutilum]